MNPLWYTQVMKFATDYDDWRRQRSCATKQKYGMTEAKRLASERGSDWRAYRCAYCGGWHLGHADPDKDANEWGF